MLFWKDRAANNYFYMADGGDGKGGGDNGKDEKVTMTKAELEAYADKRVTAGIKTYSDKATAEHAEQIKALNDKIKSFEEKGLDEKTLLEKRQKELDDLITTNKKVGNRAKVESLFAKNNLVSDDIDTLIDSVVDVDEKNTLDKANKVVEAFKKIVDKQVATKYEEAIKKNPAPKNDDSKPETMTKEKFAKLSYIEQLNFKSKYPEQAKQLMK